MNLLLIDLKFTIQLDLSNIFSILYNFLMKIVAGDNVTHLVTKIPVSLQGYISEEGNEGPVGVGHFF